MKYSDLPLQRTQSWKSVYDGAISGSDYSVNLDRINEARNAILDRAEEILTHPSTDERRALNDALRTLRMLEQTAIRGRKVV